ncbi:MAG TPA: hypothetical protein VJ508_09545 [Saprospiraceae bacterium]|nr:hypothetical protein [Saprospiraceae bacterium]
MEIFPTNFVDTYEVEGHTIKYSNFIEIAQGGPEVATLTVDGKTIGVKGDYFGGPPVFHQSKMFVPRLNKALLGRYFKICVIDLKNLSMQEVGSKEDLVLISKADDTSVYFYEDTPNTKLKSIRWN